MVIFKSAYPINVNNAVKSVPEVVSIYCSTANSVEVIVGQTGQGRSILGITDGFPPKGTESDEERLKRKKFLRELGYKM